MDQRLSRPERWRSAVASARYAKQGMQELHEQWMMKLRELREALDELRSQQASKSKDLKDALTGLVNLQNEYNYWNNNLIEPQSGSRTQEKLEEVLGFEFERLRDDIPELEKFALEDALEKFLDEFSEGSLDDAFEDLSSELGYAMRTDLPKGYGRD